MSSAGFEPSITASERPQTVALDRAATAFEFIVLLNVQGDSVARGPELLSIKIMLLR